MQDDVKVLGRIGEGAFGEVSLATCAIFGKVAVKWLKARATWVLRAARCQVSPF
jgi:hypothetical protein